MSKPYPEADVTVTPAASSAPDEVPRLRHNEHLGVSWWLTGAICAVALLAALVAAVSFGLSIGDDEADLLIGFGILMTSVAGAVWIVARIPTIFGRRPKWEHVIT